MMSLHNRFWYWYLCLYEQQAATGAKSRLIHTQSGYGIILTLASWACAAAGGVLSLIGSKSGYSFSREEVGFVAAAVAAACFLFEYLVLGGDNKRDLKIKELKQLGITITVRRRYLVLLTTVVVFFLGWFFLYLAWRLGPEF
ncbi:MAG: hypothetical protein AB8B96_17060 [Lysobacterales bacterium]